MSATARQVVDARIADVEASVPAECLEGAGATIVNLAMMATWRIMTAVASVPDPVILNLILARAAIRCADADLSAEIAARLGPAPAPEAVPLSLDNADLVDEDPKDDVDALDDPAAEYDEDPGEAAA